VAHTKLALYTRHPRSGAGSQRRWPLGLMLLGIGVALATQWLVAPHIAAQDNLKLWHGRGLACYLAQWGCASGLLYLRAR
jgi:hypothetical protein